MIGVICPRGDCTGCMACLQACVHTAIRMYSDEEGFLRPIISKDLCVECGLCQRICPVNHLPLKRPSKKVFSGWSKDLSVRERSSSGGVFSEIAKHCISKGGVVFGCALDDNQQACHICVENECDLARLRGSKYVQSKIGDSYKQCQMFLNEGREVVFSGTPCQIAGLKNYLRKSYDKLTTVDLVCHGVPSPKVFDSYTTYISKKYNSHINSISFRSKRNSWIYFGMQIEFDDPSISYYGAYYNDPFIRGFLRDYFLRPSCHQCKFTTEERVSDFTIGDWWGYRKTNNEDRDYRKKGVSLVLVNTDKALSLICQLNLHLREKTMKEALLTNSSLQRSFSPSTRRNEFWRYYNTHHFPDVINGFLNPGKVPFSVRLAQNIPNTDAIVKVISLVGRIERFLDKVVNRMKRMMLLLNQASGGGKMYCPMPIPTYPALVFSGKIIVKEQTIYE